MKIGAWERRELYRLWEAVRAILERHPEWLRKYYRDKNFDWVGTFAWVGIGVRGHPSAERVTFCVRLRVGGKRWEVEALDIECYVRRAGSRREVRVLSIQRSRDGQLFWLYEPEWFEP